MCSSSNDANKFCRYKINNVSRIQKRRLRFKASNDRIEQCIYLNCSADKKYNANGNVYQLHITNNVCWCTLSSSTNIMKRIQEFSKPNLISLYGVILTDFLYSYV